MIKTKFLKLVDAAATLKVDEDMLLLAAAESKLKIWGLLNEVRNAKRVVLDLATIDPPIIVENRVWHPMFVPLSKFAAGDLLKHGKGRVGLLTNDADLQGAVWSDDEDIPAYIQKDAVFILRTDVESLISSTHSDVSSKKEEKDLSTTERNSLLTIIAALCDYSAIKHQDRGAAAKITRLTEEIGACVSPDTVKRALEKIPDALAARMK